MNMKEKARLMGALDGGYVQYIVGHKAFPQSKLCEIFFYEDRFDIEVAIGAGISVEYSKIKNLTNSNEMKRDADRLAYGLLLPPLALAYLWKKNHVYTIIEYDDEADTQKIVLDFEKSATYAQGLIYRKMLDCRKNTESKKPVSDSSSHSPIRNTAEIKKIENDTSSHSPIRF
jgi:hypothetical protein